MPCNIPKFDYGRLGNCSRDMSIKDSEQCNGRFIKFVIVFSFIFTDIRYRIELHIFGGVSNGITSNTYAYNKKPSNFYLDRSKAVSGISDVASC